MLVQFGMETPTEEKSPIEKALAGLKFRGIGPAVMGGRISDIAIHPDKPHTWYVSAGSGNVWKTTNAGTTWTPIFDKYGSYSIGCLAIDPNNSEVIWVGTGESVSGRHVAWGDGVYRSLNGGKTFKHMGLKSSEHIGRILIDPRDSNTVFVAAEGPLWSSGGERGVYKSADGGASWQAVLEIDEDTGVGDILFDPSNPDVIYAASYQRRRHVWGLLVGGGGSGIWKSADAGQTWRRITEGLPKEEMGKIGLAVTPADPNLVYATIEAHEKEKGLYRSTNKGESWEKRSDYISGGTGPHYYQEIVASPTDPDSVYQMDVFLHCTRDGGKTFTNMETSGGKHSDNHALWVDPNNGDHLINGCDAGVYETFDHGQTWRHIPNLPLSQFYRVAVDNSEPFVNILGGAQDLGTLYGPIRTTNIEGVRNRDWSVPMGADGYHVAFHPEDNDIMYLEWQNGNIYRVDRNNMETIDIKPYPAPDETIERWNWDTPFITSTHAPDRLYCGSQRVWRSDDRGNSWTAISGDLTGNHNRYKMPYYDRVHSINNLHDNGAMSHYSTISNLSESPLVDGLLYVATDDGLIQVSEDGGANWRKAGALPDVPDLSFIQSVRADQHDADSVFAVADAHKLGDYQPYIFESNDRGKSWLSINGDLPDNTIGWAIEQDHVNPDLLILAAEFGLHVTLDRGKSWHKLSGNVPTIAFRDLKLQRRDSDIVGATFGRGFYVLDDYTSLRSLADAVEQDACLFPIRDSWWYVPNVPMQGRGEPTLGSTAFKVPNPGFGAMITFWLKEKVQEDKETRRVGEKELVEDGKDVAFPGYPVLTDEADESEPKVMVLIRDADGNALRWLEGKNEAGLQRVSWDLRLATPNAIELNKVEEYAPWSAKPQGPLVAPGEFSAELYTLKSGQLSAISEPQTFTVKAVPSLPDDNEAEAVTAFQRETYDLMRQLHGALKEVERTQTRIDHVRAALLAAPQAEPALFTQTDALNKTLNSLKRRLNADDVRQQLNEPTAPTTFMRAMRVAGMHWSTRQMPTATQRENLALAQTQFADIKQALATLIESELAALEAMAEAAGAPWTPGRRLA